VRVSCFYPTESGWSRAQTFLMMRRGRRARARRDAAMVSTGGTPNLNNVRETQGRHEHRPGTYIYNYRMGRGPASRLGRCAA